MNNEQMGLPQAQPSTARARSKVVMDESWHRAGGAGGATWAGARLNVAFLAQGSAIGQKKERVADDKVIKSLDNYHD